MPNVVLMQSFNHGTGLFSDISYERVQTWEKYSMELTEATVSDMLLSKWQWSSEPLSMYMQSELNTCSITNTFPSSPYA